MTAGRSGNSESSAGAIDRASASRAALLMWREQGKWADIALQGVSMDPIIRDGATLRVRFGVVALDGSGAPKDLEVGDVALYFSAAGLIAHRVIRVGRRGARLGWVRVKGDPLGSHKSAWIRADEILGRVICVTQPDGSRLYLNTPAGRMLSRSAAWISMTLGAVDARLVRKGPVNPADTLTGRALGLLYDLHQAAQRHLESDAGRLMSAEDRFLVQACRPRLRPVDISRVQRTALEVTDWNLVFEQAVCLGLAPLLHHSLGDERLEGLCPSWFVAQVARTSHLSGFMSLRRRQELVRVLERLETRGIEPILLKGAALGSLVYDDPALRTMNDLDLLVHEAEIPAAVEALEQLSYRPLYRAAHADPARREAFYSRHHHTTPLMEPKGRAVVELHRDIVTMATPGRYDIETIRARARRATVEGRMALVPSPADLVLHTCLHLSYADRFVGKLRDLIDLHETVCLYGDEIDWETMLSEVPSDAAARCLYTCLDLARRLYGTPVPEDFLHQVRRASKLGFLDAGALRALACSVLFNGPASGRTILPTASVKWCCDTLLRQTGWTSRLRALAALLAE
jgi:hypothetical protein